MLYIQYTHPFCIRRRIENEHTELVELVDSIRPYLFTWQLIYLSQ